MKKVLIIMLAMLITGISGIAMAGSTPGSGISGSAHDFSGGTYGTIPGSQICVLCHAPHDGGRASNATGLLWNHALSTATSYTLYSSTTLNGAITQPSGISKLCLACHDGTVAVDSFGGASGTHFVPASAKIPNLGTSTNPNLAGTHPISVVYDPSVDQTHGQTGLNPTTSSIGISGTIADILEGNLVQCSSCHDVHNQEAQGADLVRQDNAGSGLCLACHIK
ncbi:MAG: cytochrome C [Nitrospirae bacterium]|nr:cytochrome C [Nitrospirota bacterium]